MMKKSGVFLLALSMLMTSTGTVSAQEWENVDLETVVSEASGEDYGFSSGTDLETADQTESQERTQENESNEDTFTGDAFTEDNFTDGNLSEDTFTEDAFSDDGEEFSDKTVAAWADDELVDTSDVALYALEWRHKDVIKSVPEGLDTYQIKVKEGTSKPVYKVTSGNGIKVDKNGLVTLTSSTIYVDGKEDKTYWFGDNTVTVTVDGKKYNIKITVRDYAEKWAEERMDKFVDTNITSSMSQYDKVKKICEWLSQNFNYKAGYYQYVDLMLYNGGDCWANAEAVNYMCRRVGLEAYTRYAAIDAGAGSGHKNSIVIIDGERYLVDCGFEGNAPRLYELKKFSKEYSYEVLNDNTVKILQYEGLDTDVVVPESLDGHQVSEIGDYAFSKTMVEVTSVKLPDTVTTLGDKVFYNCQKLKSVTIPRNVQSIGQQVLGSGVTYESILTDIIVDPENRNFVGEDGVLWEKNSGELLAYAPGRKGTCVIPEGVTKITKSIFENNDNITEVQLPSSLREIEERAFKNCSNLKKVNIQEGLERIGSEAFYWDAEIQYLELPRTVQKIEKEAFYNIDRILVKGTETQLEDEAIREWSYTAIAAPKGSKAEKYAKSKGCIYVESIDGKKVSLNKKWFICETEGYDYSGREINPWIYSTQDSEFLRIGTDYMMTCRNNINAGTGIVEITGMGIFTGTLNMKFTIRPADMYLQYNEDLVVFKENGKKNIEFEETGKEIRPEIEVKGYKEGQDYTVSYENNKNAGWASVIITGIGNYAGTYRRSFYIKRALLNVKTGKSAYVYNGKLQKPAVTVSLLGKKLKSSDYMVWYYNNKDIGTATIEIVGKGKYSAYYDIVYFKIIPATVSVKTVKSSAKGKLTVQWSKKSGITGYQVSYSTKKDFSEMKYQNIKNASGTLTLSKLKSGKKYYVRVRSYKKVSGKTYYSGWSSVKNVTIK